LEGKFMGEVRVKVKLINAIDEGMARRGKISPKEIRVYETEAVVDTGSVSPVLPIHVVQELGLELVRKTRATSADASNIIVDISEPVGISISGRRTTLEAVITGDEVLIGQTVLETVDMFVDCVNQKLIPNPAHPDQPVLKLK
jgi:clan AA aspartic protease